MNITLTNRYYTTERPEAGDTLYDDTTFSLYELVEFSPVGEAICRYKGQILDVTYVTLNREYLYKESEEMTYHNLDLEMFCIVEYKTNDRAFRKDRRDKKQNINSFADFSRMKIKGQKVKHRMGQNRNNYRK